MKARVLHPWRVSHAEAVGVQEALRPRLVSAPLPTGPRLVAGADVAYSRRTHRVYAAVVVVALPALETIETAGVARPAAFPYVPGLLSFREAPPLLEAFERLSQAPDVLVFDGQGLAHPRRFGISNLPRKTPLSKVYFSSPQLVAEVTRSTVWSLAAPERVRRRGRRSPALAG